MPKSAAPTGYRPEIDGLRAIAVVPVVLYHAGVPWMPGGFVGVDVFFVISGYLITRLILAERAAGTFSLWQFYERRARRILPALVVVLAASLPLAWALMMPRELWAFGESVLAALAFVANIHFWTESGYFAPKAGLVPQLHTWSLAVEEQFYLLYPALIGLLWHVGRVHLAICIGALCLVSMSFVLWIQPDDPDAAFYLLPGRVWELGAGALAALALAQWPELGRVRGGTWMALAGLAAIAGAVLLLHAASGVPGPAALLPVGGTLLVILFAGSGPARALLASRPMIAIGLISYSAYLWHHPILAFARFHWLGEPPLWAVAAAVLLTFWLAALTWAVVEQPFRDRHRIGSRAALLWGCAGLLIVAGAACWLALAQPAGGRVTPEIAAADRGLQTLRRERRQLIGFGRCQFAEGRATPSPAEFLDAWDCTGPGPMPAGLVVVGDSHAADTAAALRLAGHPVTQMTGAGCDLSPATMRPVCRQLFDALKARLAAETDKPTILLVNRWRRTELTGDALSAMARYWRDTGGDLVFLTSRPTWDSFAMKTVRGADRPGPGPFAQTCFEPETRFSGRSETPEVRTVLSASGIRVLTTRPILLAATGPCGPWAPDGTPMLVDNGHLSAAGARAYGTALAAALGLGEGSVARAPIGAID